MRTYTVTVSDDAAAMLDEMQREDGAKPENVISTMAESQLSTCFESKSYRQDTVRDARHPRSYAKQAWESSLELFS